MWATRKCILEETESDPELAVGSNHVESVDPRMEAVQTHDERVIFGAPALFDHHGDVVAYSTPTLQSYMSSSVALTMPSCSLLDRQTEHFRRLGMKP